MADIDVYADQSYTFAYLLWSWCPNETLLAALRNAALAHPDAQYLDLAFACHAFLQTDDGALDPLTSICLEVI